MYFADTPSKTVTGTIAIQVENSNDHCPTIPTTMTRVCSNEQFIDFTIEDRDSHPHGGPFTVTILDQPERMSDRWVISRIDGKKALLWHIFPSCSFLCVHLFPKMIEVSDLARGVSWQRHYRMQAFLPDKHMYGDAGRKISGCAVLFFGFCRGQTGIS